MRLGLRLLLIFSLSLNAAFVVAWGSKTLTRSAVAARRETRPCASDSCRIWCPLHRALGTTGVQWQALEPLQRRFQDASQALADSADRLRADLINLLAQPALDQNALAARQADIAAVQRQMQTLVVNHLLDEKRILNPEQQAQLFALMRDHDGCAGHRGLMGAGGGGRGCPKEQTETHSR